MPGAAVTETIEPDQLTLFEGGPDVRKLRAVASLIVLSAQAKKTREAYAHGWKHFTTWCGSVGREPLPATQDTLKLYIVDHLEKYSIATIKQRISAIVDKHRSQKVDDPYTYSVKELMRGASRKKGRAQQQKEALSPNNLHKACAAMLKEKSARAIRDRAIMTIGFAGAMRRSEIVALDVEDVRFAPKGVAINIRQSKTDQEGKGREVGIFYAKHARSCPVRALRDWLYIRGRGPGPLFTNAEGTHHRLRAPTIAAIVKRRLKAIGLNPETYGAHSLRAGCITAAATAGEPDSLIMKRSGHRSIQTVATYVRPATIFAHDILRRAM